MAKRTPLYCLLLGLLYLGTAGAQYPLVDAASSKVLQKYQQATCEQLWQDKAKPKTQMEKDFIKLLRDDPKMRAAFIDKVAAPIANKMFECGMIP
jgi:hypothetical protein